MKGLTTIAALPGSGAGSTSALRAETMRVEKFGNRMQKNGPYYMPGTDIVVSTRHHPGDGRGPRNVYVDGELAPQCLEADTEEGWAIVMREDGVKETLKGAVEVVRAWTGKEGGQPWVSLVDALKEPEVGKDTTIFRWEVKPEETKEAGPTPADMAAHPAWGFVTPNNNPEWVVHFQGEPVDTDSEGSL